MVDDVIWDHEEVGSNPALRPFIKHKGQERVSAPYV